jgi:hypothetical protein
MRYVIRVVSDDDELVRLAHVATTWDRKAQACVTADPPTVDQMRDLHRIYAAYLDGQPVAFVLCSEIRMIWLMGHPEHIAPACVAIADVIHHDFAPAWGEVNNPELRAAIAAASGGKIVDDGRCNRWVGD